MLEQKIKEKGKIVRKARARAGIQRDCNQLLYATLFGHIKDCSLGWLHVAFFVLFSCYSASHDIPVFKLGQKKKGELEWKNAREYKVC